MAADTWGLSWGGTLGAWGTSWARGFTPPAPQPEGQTPAGRPRRRRYYVEFDGQRFDVSGPQEAQELLDRARALAERAAELAAQNVVDKRKPERKVRVVKLSPPKVVASPELHLNLEPIRNELQRVYENAAAMAELQLLLRKAAEEDDEDAILWLM